jgi:hypothetical protein
MRMFRCNRDASPVPEHQGTSRAMILPTTRWHSPVKSNAAIIAPSGTLRLSAIKFGSARRALAVTISRLILGRR